MKIVLSAEQYVLFHNDLNFRNSIYKRCSDFFKSSPAIESISIARVGQVTPFLSGITQDDPNVLAVTDGVMELDLHSLYSKLSTWYSERYVGDPDTDTLNSQEAQMIFDTLAIVEQLRDRNTRMFIKDITQRPVVVDQPEEENPIEEPVEEDENNTEENETVVEP